MKKYILYFVCLTLVGGLASQWFLSRQKVNEQKKLRSDIISSEREERTLRVELEGTYSRYVGFIAQKHRFNKNISDQLSLLLEVQLLEQKDFDLADKSYKLISSFLRSTRVEKNNLRSDFFMKIEVFESRIEDLRSRHIRLVSAANKVARDNFARLGIPAKATFFN
jgi:hypothetical protein